MSSLSWITGEIELESVASSATDVTGLLSKPEVQISFVHEYVHFLQLVTSVGGIRLLADLIDLGVRGALLLSSGVRLKRSGRRVSENTSVA